MEILTAANSPSPPNPEANAPAVEGLSMEVAGMTHPVYENTEMTYIIRVSNKAAIPIRQISVRATAPRA